MARTKQTARRSLSPSTSSAPTEPAVTLRWSELRQLPTDVLVSHLIPLLVEQEDRAVPTDVWAERMLGWMMPRKGTRVREWAEWDVASECDMGAPDHVLWEDDLTVFDIDLFVVFGPWDVTLTAYRSLIAASNYGFDSMRNWAAHRERRRKRQQHSAAAASTQEEDDNDKEEKESEGKEEANEGGKEEADNTTR